MQDTGNRVNGPSNKLDDNSTDKDKTLKEVASKLVKFGTNLETQSSEKMLQKIKDSIIKLHQAVLPWFEQYQDACTQAQIKRRITRLQKNKAVGLDQYIKDLLDNIAERVIERVADGIDKRIKAHSILQSMKDLSSVINSNHPSSEQLKKLIDSLEQSTITPVTYLEYAFHCLVVAYCYFKDGNLRPYNKLYNLHSILQFAIEVVKKLPATEQYKQIRSRADEISEESKEQEKSASTSAKPDIDKLTKLAQSQEEKEKVRANRYVVTTTYFVQHEHFLPDKVDINEEMKDLLVDFTNFIKGLDQKSFQNIENIVGEEKCSGLKGALQKTTTDIETLLPPSTAVSNSVIKSSRDFLVLLS